MTHFIMLHAIGAKGRFLFYVNANEIEAVTPYQGDDPDLRSTVVLKGGTHGYDVTDNFKTIMKRIQNVQGLNETETE